MTCLSLWERWPSAARTERTLSVTCGDSSPKGRAKEGEPRRESQGGEPRGLASPSGRGGRAQRGRRGYPQSKKGLAFARPFSIVTFSSAGGRINTKWR